MVFPVIVQVVWRAAPIIVRAVQKYYKYESKLFNKAYRGVPKGIGYGVRHGYVAGSVIGSYFSSEMNGQETPERRPNSIGKARGTMGQSRTKRKYGSSYSNMQRRDTSKCVCGKRRGYWR